MKKILICLFIWSLLAPVTLFAEEQDKPIMVAWSFSWGFPWGSSTGSTPSATYYLLMETGDALLLEDGDNILLESEP